MRLYGIGMFLLGCGLVVAGDLPSGYWSEAQADEILSRTGNFELAPDLSKLDPAERHFVDLMLQVGDIFHRLHLQTLHPESQAAHARLLGLHLSGVDPSRTEKLLRLFALFNGPVATTLDNRREAFLPVHPEGKGKNFYPQSVTEEELGTYLLEHPEQAKAILAVRTIVRRTADGHVAQDLEKLKHYPDLDMLHPDLRQTLAWAQDGRLAYYALPYAFAFAEELHKAYQLLHQASLLMAEKDPDLADYLNNRARDLLSNNYESGDAAWVRGRFGKFNLQIGSYETYDDGLFGVKSAFSFSLLIRDEEKTAALQRSLAGIQELENKLPYDHHKKVQEDIPVGVYEVIADFGQSRTANTASILPNEASFARKYGRTILLRYNIMANPVRFEAQKKTWVAAVAPAHHDEIHPDGQFNRTLWHEVGHYLGPATDQLGRSHGEVLAPFSSAFEEMKADLVSLFCAKFLRERGIHDDRTLRAIYASGIQRVLLSVKPRRTQPYQTMMLMQWNYFLEKGLLHFDAQTGLIHINYDKYHHTVRDLLQEIIAIQWASDGERGKRFVERYGFWRDDLHDVVAERMRASSVYRFTQMGYEALKSQ